VLKNFGYCYEAETKIHPDVNGDCGCKQSAVIDYKTGGTNQVFTWDGANECIDLAGISFFNNNCVRLSLDAERTLLVSPIGFHLFIVMIKELGELSKHHKTKIAAIETSLSWEDSLHDETEVQKFVSSLSKKSKDVDVDAFALFTGEYETDLKAKKEEIKKVNKELLNKEITDLNQYISELNRIIKIIEGHQNRCLKSLCRGLQQTFHTWKNSRAKSKSVFKILSRKKAFSSTTHLSSWHSLKLLISTSPK
jgi:hypothetical protein